MITRRRFLTSSAALAGSSAINVHAQSRAYLRERPGERPAHPAQSRPGAPTVVTPNGAIVPWKWVGGVKVYHLVAEPVRHEFAPGLIAECWGYNGRVHGPTLEAFEGDRVRVYVTNKLPAPTSVHWHGIILPNGMDGVGGLTQRAIQPGETFKYEWTFRQHGTFMYHSHHDEMVQMGMGLMGLFVVHPKAPQHPRPDRDFALLLSEWRIDPGTFRPNPNEMTDFNLLTINGRCFPGTAPLTAKVGQRVRIRFGNLSAMDHHPIHLHGHSFKIVATDGGDIPPSAQWPESGLLVPVGTTRDIEFIADNPGDWALHCHMTHHLMNQMGHDLPNMLGVNPASLDPSVQSLLPQYMTMGQNGMAEHGRHIEYGHMQVPKNSIPMVGAQGPFDYITMGGMFTIVKVREQLASDDDPGWYQHPPGTVSDLARAEELQRDGIERV
jgi:FtsP/CotA-like multicopper oxidase with cupredoxin domain